MDKDFANFCSGGCSEKLGPGFLASVLEALPKFGVDDRLLVGYDTADDAAVFRLNEGMAIIQTLDFFPPMVEDPYLFGKIAAANALSDVYAMGGDVLMALNIVTFPQKGDPAVLGEVLRGGAEKVNEAGAVLAGGHSINDDGIKYGLCVMGIVHPNRVLANNTARPGDALVLTKPLGVGLVTAAYQVGEVDGAAYCMAVGYMQQLNKAASEVSRGYDVGACTDVTGFGFLGHLCEMLNENVSALISVGEIPCVPGAKECAEKFILTSGGQRNRNFVGARAKIEISFPMQEILFDPQTSGGLIVAVREEQAPALLDDMKAAGVDAVVVGKMVEKLENDIIVS